MAKNTGTLDKTKQETDSKLLSITPPRMGVIKFLIEGTAPLMIAKFSAKAINAIKETQEAGSAAKTKKKREARDFSADAHNARHISRDGWDGVAAAAFRNASIDACRAAGFVMTRAKLCIFCEADGLDAETNEPLVKIIADGPHEETIMAVRNASGVMDLRSRPLWHNWQMEPRLRFDMDILTAQDVVNLIARVGLQVGIGEGRPYGRDGAGIGYGLFRIVDFEIQAPGTSADGR